MSKIKLVIAVVLLVSCSTAKVQTSASQSPSETYNEPYRPQIHFSPQAHWMNDPNGMVYYKGTYHLFYQYYPDSTVWGPMHWGHATSRDLLHWQHQPIALYPDSLGYIFSGSAVVDVNNTSGFGKDGKVPLVAIFTHHDPKGEKAGRNDFQNQSIAYSLDSGKTWTKYAGNPVLHNPGIRDFRDPKVSWYEPQKKWIMTLATLDRITFYSSPDLKHWTKESEFGKELGAHGGVWECPDLFSLEDKGKKVWVLIVNLNPGGPNGGSATQYFLGDFDGHTFTPATTETKWLDYGPDEYAGVTWSNTGNRKIFLGWMSNWEYATVVPTEKWRSAMTIPRQLRLVHAGKDRLIASEPVPELNRIESKETMLTDVGVTPSFDLASKTGSVSFPSRLDINTDKVADFSITLSNIAGEKVVIGYDKKANQYYIDRTRSGKTNFQKDFAAKHAAPRFATDNNIRLSLIMDVSSVELFGDNGLSVMTEIFFPTQPFNQIHIQSSEGMVLQQVKYATYKSIWK